MVERELVGQPVHRVDVERADHVPAGARGDEKELTITFEPILPGSS